ncbi:MAG: hypothetical protein AB1768_08405 [Pseudomonadota bacterium]
MPKPKKNSIAKNNGGATVGYEARLWQMADALRGSMDAAEYRAENIFWAPPRPAGRPSTSPAGAASG